MGEERRRSGGELEKQVGFCRFGAGFQGQSGDFVARAFALFVFLLMLWATENRRLEGGPDGPTLLRSRPLLQGPSWYGCLVSQELSKNISKLIPSDKMISELYFCLVSKTRKQSRE